VNPADPNIQRVELVVAALGDLRDELVLVGGCAASLLIDAPTAPPPRVTFDVDLIAEVAALRNYHALEKQFTLRGFKRDVSPEAPICRWRLGVVEVDLMPTDETVLGFSNRWYPLAASSATRLVLPSGATINLISAPAFLATKFEAFKTRGQGDPLLSHDLEDIINVVEGRMAIEAEIVACEQDLHAYLAAQFGGLVALPDFQNILPGLVAYDELHSRRVNTVMRKILAFAALTLP
jgi:predicted nucleotidyltransferase